MPYPVILVLENSAIWVEDMKNQLQLFIFNYMYYQLLFSPIDFELEDTSVILDTHSASRRRSLTMNR
jgi:hypothetical protein